MLVSFTINYSQGSYVKHIFHPPLLSGLRLFIICWFCPDFTDRYLFRMSVLSLFLPFHPYKVDTDVNGKQPLVLCQAHLQELIPIQLLHRLVLKILEGVGKMSLVYLLQEEGKWQDRLGMGLKSNLCKFRAHYTVCPYLLALLRRLDIDLCPLLKRLSEHVSNQRFPSDLHGHHVPGSFQHCLGSGELTANIIFGQLHRLSWELLRFVTLVTVSQILSELLWS